VNTPTTIAAVSTCISMSVPAAAAFSPSDSGAAGETRRTTTARS
jgi:hypothetical protein